MKPSRLDPRSIRVYLTVLALVAALPLAGLAIRSSFDSYQVELRRGEVEVRRLADITAASTIQLLANTRSVLDGTAVHLDLAGSEPGACGAILVNARDLAPHLANIVATDAQGLVRCSAMALPPATTFDVSERGWFKEVRDGSPFAVGTPLVSRITPGWIMGLAVPILDSEGDFAGAVVGSVPLVGLQDLLAGAPIDSMDLVTIANADRIVLARSNDPEGYVGRRIPPDTAASVFVGPFSGGADMEGVARTWSTADISSVGWIVHAGTPTERVLAPARAALRNDLGLGLLMLLLAAALAYAVQRSISTSLVRVVEMARAEGRGQYPPLPSHGPSEIRALASQLHDSFEACSRAEASERIAKDRYRSILDHAVFGIGVTTHDGTFVEANPALAAMLGYGSMDELKSVDFGALFVEADAHPALVRAIEDSGVLLDREATWVRRDGSHITCRINGRKVDLGPHSAAYEIIVQDITGQKELESALRHSQKIEAVGQLAGGIAHDFNNLLTVISGNTELLLAQMPGDDPFRPDVLEISAATERAEGVTQQLLALSRKDVVDRRAVEVNEVIGRFESILGRLIGEHIHVRTLLADDLPPAQANPVQIEQVLLNLAINGRDAMPDGGTLTIETYYAAARPDSGPPVPGAGWICVAVEDDGCGMSEEVLERVFEPYYTTKPIGSGTGLGLATAYANVAAMGGMLSATSTPGEGTRFEMWLGVAEVGTQASEDSATGSDGMPTGSESILVVEDETGLRRFVERVLVSAGYSVTVAEDGTEAIDILDDPETPAFDLVLTDLVMPRRSGAEVVEAVRARHAATAALIMTGYSAGLPVEELIGDDVDMLLHKPFSISLLCTRVRWALDRRATVGLSSRDGGSTDGTVTPGSGNPLETPARESRTLETRPSFLATPSA